MKKTTLIIALGLMASISFAQKKTTTSAIISFDATTSLDKLPKADNKTVIASLDTKTGKLAFESTIKSFTFSNPKIQEHFNTAGWMDSESALGGHVIAVAHDGRGDAVRGVLLLRSNSLPVCADLWRNRMARSLKRRSSLTLKKVCRFSSTSTQPTVHVKVLPIQHSKLRTQVT